MTLEETSGEVTQCSSTVLVSMPGGRLMLELEEKSCISGKFEDRASDTNQDMIYKL